MKITENSSWLTHHLLLPPVCRKFSVFPWPPGHPERRPHWTDRISIALKHCLLRRRARSLFVEKELESNSNFAKDDVGKTPMWFSANRKSCIKSIISRFDVFGRSIDPHQITYSWLIASSLNVKCVINQLGGFNAEISWILAHKSNLNFLIRSSMLDLIPQMISAVKKTSGSFCTNSMSSGCDNDSLMLEIKGLSHFQFEASSNRQTLTDRVCSLQKQV